MRRLALLLLLLAVSSACARGNDLGDVVLEEGPPRYELVEDRPSGPLDLEAASGATTIAPETMRGYLEEHGFQEGYQRTWQRGENDFAVVALFQMRDGEAATGLVEALTKDMLAKEAALPIETRGVPDAVAFTLGATQRGGEAQVMCHIFLFPEGRRVFEVRGCAGRAMPSEPFRVMAVQQYRRATAET